MRPSSQIDRLHQRLSLRRILLAVVAYYVVVTYQFVRIRPTLDQDPDGVATMLGIDTAASLPAEYLSYLLGATIGDWGTSILYARPVTAQLAASLPWLAILVTVAAVAAGAAVWLLDRLEGAPVPAWVIAAVAYGVTFLVGTSLLVGAGTQAAGFFLEQATATRDVPLLLGGRRLLALGFLVGALVVSSSGRLAAEESLAGSTATPQGTN